MYCAVYREGERFGDSIEQVVYCNEGDLENHGGFPQRLLELLAFEDGGRHTWFTRWSLLIMTCLLC